MRVGVSGSQAGYTVAKLDTLAVMINSPRIGNLVHGGCVGIDCEADAAFERMGHDDYHRPYVRTVDVYPAFGSKGVYAKPQYLDIERAPLDRDHLIVAQAELMLIVPRQDYEIRRSGTWSTCRYAVKAGVITLVIISDGTVRRAEELLGRKKEEVIHLP
jgi:hypothetical protein